MNNDRSFISLATRREVVVTAFKVAVVVGTILCAINQAPAYMNNEFSEGNFLQMMFTYFVPYCVSTYSSVKMIRKYAS